MAEPRRIEVVQDKPVEVARGVSVTLKSVLEAHARNKAGESVNDMLMQVDVTANGKTERVTLHRLYPGAPEFVSVAGVQLGIDFGDAYHQPSTGALLVK